MLLDNVRKSCYINPYYINTSFQYFDILHIDRNSVTLELNFFVQLLSISITVTNPH